MWQWLTLLLGLTACQAELPPIPPASPPAGPVMRVVGEVTRIVLRNIHKAEGHHTCNIELSMKVAALTPPTPQPVGTLTVRLLERPTWRDLSEAERARLSPSGPAHTLETDAWGPYRVGADLDVRAVRAGVELAVMAEPTPK